MSNTHSISVLCNPIAVKEILTVTALSDINRLMHQLTARCNDLSTDDLERIVSQGRYLYLKQQGMIIGVTTLLLLYKSTGWFAEIHDDVVDSEFRECGIGRALMEQAIVVAKQGGAKYIELTSNPSRMEANRLYRKLGFVCIARANSTKKGGMGTNLYRLKLD